MNNNLKAFICRIAYSPIGDKLVSFSGVRRLWTELHVRSQKKHLLANARREYLKESAPGRLEDYERALKKHWISYSEYAHQYEFYDKAETERSEFVARLKMGYFYWRYAPGAAKAVFRNKPVFLRTFGKFVHRKWLYVPEASFEEFEQMISSQDCIIKPSDGKLGRGVFKVPRGGDGFDVRELFEQGVRSRALIEQCIESCEALKAFHPQSLNTIRVVTVANREKAVVFGSFLRTGVGDSVVDNAHAGGLFAQINVETGIIESDGINVDGMRCECHPDSNVRFKGFKIPEWDDIVRSCCEAARMTDNPITGWDVAISSRGEVEFVEGNYGPDFDVMQSPLKVGVKKKIYALIKEYRGIEMQ